MTLRSKKSNGPYSSFSIHCLRARFLWPFDNITVTNSGIMEVLEMAFG